ncbi:MULTISPECIES: hypothetical protein [unclassified Pseudofrankia]|uniref:hypothetical protein n=1 Tax=unclassified Pseudofrankia TaxID=2994372 RepID=UPI0008D92BD2|nr:MULTISPECIES: hypothetical protein [unclassified Pseudofrankia]MDT3441022.1 nuclear transport factor 2 family protein [Pseudofrankia sp. BMG5.37]OHV42535.1 hypothetical protein BCD48_30810 [Pseudofrankia sp. BMG5.36]
MSGTTLPGEDLRAYLTRYPEELTFGDEPPGEVFDRYHTPDFVMVSDGVALDRQRLIDHVTPARRRAVAVAVEVADALVAGDRVAARYTLSATMRKGAPIVTEIVMLGRLAPDGRLTDAHQLTRTPATED